MKMNPTRTGRSFIGFRWMVCRKQFTATPAGWRSFRAERRAACMFREYDWMPPWRDWGISWRGRPWFETDRHPKKQRLDLVCRTATKEQKREYALKALSVALDLYAAGWAHRDLKPANFFVRDDGGLVLKDFETLCRYPAKKPSFLGSYDLTGRGLPSPFRTAHMGLFALRPDAFGPMFGIDVEEAPALVEELLRRELRDGAVSFGGRQRVPPRGDARPYTSMPLRFLTVARDEARRDTEKRLAKLGVNAEVLAGRSILDLGCHCGGMLFALQRFHPGPCLGVESDASLVAVARRIAAFENFQNTAFVAGDVDFVKPEDIGGPRDVVLCLGGIERHLRYSARLFWLLGQTCRDLLFLEGTPDSDIGRMTNLLKRNGFQTIESRGTCDDDSEPGHNTRPVLVVRKSGPVPAAYPPPPPEPTVPAEADLQVSVVVSMPDAEAAVDESVQSALAQPETGEVLLMEAADGESSSPACARLAESDARIKRIPVPADSPSGGWIGQGIQAAACPCVAFLQAGDVFLPGRFAGARRAWAAHPDADGVHDAVDTILPVREKGLWAGRPRKRRVGVLGRVAPEELFRLLVEGGNGRLHLEGMTAKRSFFDRVGSAEPGTGAEGDEEPDDIIWMRMAAAGRLVPGGVPGAVAEQRVPSGGTARNRRVTPRREASMILWREMAIWLAAQGFDHETVCLAARRYQEEVHLIIHGLRLLRANRQALSALRFTLCHPECRAAGGLGSLAVNAFLPALVLRRGSDALWSLLRGRFRIWRKLRRKIRRNIKRLFNGPPPPPPEETP